MLAFSDDRTSAPKRLSAQSVAKFGAFGLASAALGHVLVDPVRAIEAGATAGVLGTMTGKLFSSIGPRIIVPNETKLFITHITPSCSATYLVFAMVFCGLAFLRNKWSQRLMIVGIGVTIALLINFIRLTLIGLVGLDRGRGASETFHGVIGTPITIAAAVFAIASMWWASSRMERRKGLPASPINAGSANN